MWGCPGSVSLIYCSLNLLGSQWQGFISMYLLSQRPQVTLTNTVAIRAVGASDMGCKARVPHGKCQDHILCWGAHARTPFYIFPPPSCGQLCHKKLCQPCTGPSLLPLAFWAHMLRDIAQKSCDRNGGEIHFTIAILCIQLCHSTN